MRLTAIAIAAALSGCALAPGMALDRHAAIERGRATDPHFDIQPISSTILARLEEQRVREAVLVPDPQGDRAIEPYRVAPFDVLQVIVWDHPELTTPTGQFRSPEDNGNLVQADGTVYYPHVGVIQAAGKTVTELRGVLTERLAYAIMKPQLDVRVAAFRGRRVQVTGEVVAPSPMPLTEVPARVQDAIAFAKGFTPEADPSNVTLTRDGKPHHLDLLAMYEEGVLSQNWLLRDGDVIHVPDRNANRVFVMGEVKVQQAKLMTKRRMTLAEAIGESGGFDLTTANTTNLYVIRGDYGAPSIFHLDASSPDALLLATHFQLRPKDIVYVSTNGVTQWNRVISQILPTVQTLYDLAVSAGIAKNALK